jgi:hypothetical protein
MEEAKDIFGRGWEVASDEKFFFATKERAKENDNDDGKVFAAFSSSSRVRG